MKDQIQKLWPTIALLAVILLVALLARVPQEQPEAPKASPATVHAYPANMKVSIDPTTHWQPRSGAVKIILENANPEDKTTLADALVAVQFRWRTSDDKGAWVQSPDVRTLEIVNAKKLVVSAAVPEMPPSPSDAFVGLFKDEAGIRTFLTLVPEAEVWVTATNANNAALINAVRTIGVTSWWVGFTAALAVVALLLLFLYLNNKPAGLRAIGFMLKIIEAPDGRASLSQFQVMLWTLLVGAATAYVIALSGNLIVLTPGTLMLLGISGAASLGTSLAPPGAAGVTPKLARGEKPAWSDLVVAGGQIDVTRVQMLFFTVLTALYVAIHVLDDYEIPAIPETFQTLMGLSNGVYLANKFVAGSLTEQQARQRLAAAGYATITAIAPKGDGAWTATVTDKAGTDKTVTVAKDGTVA